MGNASASRRDAREGRNNDNPGKETTVGDNSELLARVNDPIVCTDALHHKLAAALEAAEAENARLRANMARGLAKTLADRDEAYALIIRLDAQIDAVKALTAEHTVLIPAFKVLEALSTTEEES